MTAVPEPVPIDRLTMTPRQARFQEWVTDLLIFVLVLNFFVEFAPAVIIESFAMSVLTAVLLKILVDVILALEHRASNWFRSREGRTWAVLGVAATLAILFASKFVILEVTHFVFGDLVRLGGFIEVALLVIALICARKATDFVYTRLLGPTRDAPAVG